MYLEKLRKVNPKRAEILEKLLFPKKKTAHTETGELLAKGLSQVKTLAEVRSVAKSVLPDSEVK